MFIQTERYIINTDKIRLIEKDQGCFGKAEKYLRVYFMGTGDLRCCVNESEKGYKELFELK